ncbi:unnamed protein product [Auanema sp. JU1783]|nr:unnamed protein product [Auanema sp. JU1783]
MLRNEVEPLIKKPGNVLIDTNYKGRKVLSWHHLYASVPLQNQHRGHTRKQVIENVSGIALPGEVLAIMGGSGAGKTTLMNILAHLPTKGVEKQGNVLVNGKTLTKTQMRSISAYVQQEDVFCGTLTVKEQLTYSALLRMGRQYSNIEKREKVEQLIAEMNLVECQNTLIGIPNRTKGISIGEKKRLSFACESLTDPAIMYCDEPTSGLDAFMAAQVVSALKLMAEKGKTIVTVIHQPSSTVFKMFNKVCFMANGKTAYHGPVSEICSFFESLNVEHLRVPESYNPADHFIAKLSISGETADKDLKQIELIRNHYDTSELGQKMLKAVEEQRSMGFGEKAVTDFSIRYFASFWIQFVVLFQRSFLTTLRDPLLLKVRLIQVVLTALVISTVNFRTPVYGPTVKNMEGVLYNAARDMNFLFLFPSINVITCELPIFLREHKSRIYSVGSYYLAKSLAELPQYAILPLIYSAIVYWTTGLVESCSKFLIFSLVCMLLTQNAVSVAYAGAAVFGEEAIAVTYLPMLILPMLTFGGYYINFHSIPSYLQPFSYFSWFRYGFEALEINQWKEITHIEGCTGLLSQGNNTVFCPGENGEDILYRRGMDGEIAPNLLLLTLFSVLFRMIGFVALSLRAKYSK